LAEHDKYLIQLRRELVRAQARLKRAEQECDRLRLENERLRELAKASAKKTERKS
jgi:regulator of replication initiation timing